MSRVRRRAINASETGCVSLFALTYDVTWRTFVDTRVPS
jgi:hypothetical protein